MLTAWQKEGLETMLRRFAQAAQILRASLRQHSVNAAVHVRHVECGGAQSQLQEPSLAQLLASAAALRPSELAGSFLPWRQLSGGAASCAGAAIRGFRLQLVQQRGYNSLPQWQILSKPKCGLAVAQAISSAGCSCHAPATPGMLLAGTPSCAG